MAGRIVEMQLPACAEGAGPWVKVLWGIHTVAMWVEFTMENITYIRTFLRTYMSDDPPARKRQRKARASKAQQAAPEEKADGEQLDA